MLLKRKKSSVAVSSRTLYISVFLGVESIVHIFEPHQLSPSYVAKVIAFWLRGESCCGEHETWRKL